MQQGGPTVVVPSSPTPPPASASASPQHPHHHLYGPPPLSDAVRAHLATAEHYEGAGRPILAIKAFEKALADAVAEQPTSTPQASRIPDYILAAAQQAEMGGAVDNASLGSSSSQQHHHPFQPLADIPTSELVTVPQVAERLILRCNAAAVAAFRGQQQQDGEDTSGSTEDFGLAEELLTSALRMTEPEVGSFTSNATATVPTVSSYQRLQDVPGNRFFAPTTRRPLTPQPPAKPHHNHSSLPAVWKQPTPAILRLRATTLNNFGCLERRRRNYSRALQLFELVGETDADQLPAAQLNTSALLSQLGRTDEAVAAAQKAVAAIVKEEQEEEGGAPSGRRGGLGAVAYHNLAMALELKSTPQCLAAYEKAVTRAAAELGPTHPTTEAIELNAYRFTQYAQAEAEKKALLEHQPADPSVLVVGGGGAAPRSHKAILAQHQQHGLKGKRPSSLGSTVAASSATGGGFYPSSTAKQPTPPAPLGPLRHSTARTSVATDSLVTTTESAAALLVDTETPLQKSIEATGSRPPLQSGTPSSPVGPAGASSGGGAKAPQPPSKTKRATSFRMASQAKEAAAAADGDTTAGGFNTLLQVRQPPPLDSEILELEARKKDDIVAYLATRLTQLLKVEDAFETRYTASVKIQCVVRKSLARKRLLVRRSRRDNETGLRLRRERRAARAVIRFLSRIVQKKKARIAERAENLAAAELKLTAITKMQSIGRMWHARRLADRIRRRNYNFDIAVRKLQSWTRQRLAVMTAERMRSTLQSSKASLKLLERQHRAAYLLQAAYKFHRSKITLLVMRGDLKAARERDWQRSRTHAAVYIQKAFRGYLVRKLYGETLRVRSKKRVLTERTQRRRRSATKIQACFRGHRNRVSSHKYIQVHLAKARAAAVANRRFVVARAIQCMVRCHNARAEARRRRDVAAAQYLASKGTEPPLVNLDEEEVY